MARFQRFIPVLAVVLIVILGGTALFIAESQVVRAAAANANAAVNISSTQISSQAEPSSYVIDMPGLPY